MSTLSSYNVDSSGYSSITANSFTTYAEVDTPSTTRWGIWRLTLINEYDWPAGQNSGRFDVSIHVEAVIPATVGFSCTLNYPDVGTEASTFDDASATPSRTTLESPTTITVVGDYVLSSTPVTYAPNGFFDLKTYIQGTRAACGSTQSRLAYTITEIKFFRTFDGITYTLWPLDEGEPGDTTGTFAIYTVSGGETSFVQSFSATGSPKLAETDESLWVYDINSKLLNSREGGINLTNLIPSGVDRVQAIARPRDTFVFSSTKGYAATPTEHVGDWKQQGALPSGFTPVDAVGEMSYNITCLVGSSATTGSDRVYRSSSGSPYTFSKSDTGMPLSAVTDLEIAG